MAGAHPAIMVEHSDVEPDEPAHPKQRVQAHKNQTSQAVPLNLLNIDACCEGAISEDAQQVHIKAHLDQALEVDCDVRRRRVIDRSRHI